MSPIVSLDVLPADVPGEYAPAMVAACSGALAEGSCVLASSLPESTRPEAVALVLWQGNDYLQVTVRVGRGGGEWAVRALTFVEGDSISERWTTVGLTIATLVGESRALEPRASTNAQPVPSAAPPRITPPRPRATPGSPQRAPRESRPIWLAGAGALVGPGWDGGSWQRGGWVSLSFRVPRLPFQLHALGSYALSDGPTVARQQVEARWLMAGIGAGVYGVLPRLSLSASAALELGYRRIQVSYGGQEANDQEIPLRLRALASVPAEGTFAATFGLVLRLPPNGAGRTEDSVLREAAPSLEAVAGLEVRL